MKEKPKKTGNACGRCESEELDVKEKRFRTPPNVEVRYRCLKCGYEWSEYKQVR